MLTPQKLEQYQWHRSRFAMNHMLHKCLTDAAYEAIEAGADRFAEDVSAFIEAAESRERSMRASLKIMAKLVG